MRKKHAVHSTRELIDILNLQTDIDSPPLRLTPRGKEALKWLSEGKSFEQTAEKMHISVSGVRRHCDNIMIQNDCYTLEELTARYRAQFPATRTALEDT